MLLVLLQWSLHFNILYLYILWFKRTNLRSITLETPSQLIFVHFDFILRVRNSKNSNEKIMKQCMKILGRHFCHYVVRDIEMIARLLKNCDMGVKNYCQLAILFMVIPTYIFLHGCNSIFIFSFNRL